MFDRAQKTRPASSCSPAEDDAEDTIVPRLMAAGADRARVTFVQGIRRIYRGRARAIAG